MTSEIVINNNNICKFLSECGRCHLIATFKDNRSITV